RAQCHRLRSDVTQWVIMIEGEKPNVHASLLKVTSGQLRNLGSLLLLQKKRLAQEKPGTGPGCHDLQTVFT
ncbi:MAG: hypothetical protein ACREXG_09170, partial [Polaromonas sp.]